MRSPSPRLTVYRLATRPAGWFALVGIAAIALGLGSVHRGPQSRVARISQLENIIKCPACAGISIAQSDSQSAAGLRDQVTQWVDEGWSDQRIEDAVVSEYTTAEILRPTNRLLWILPMVVVALGVAGVARALLARRGFEHATLSELDEQLVSAALDKRR